LLCCERLYCAAVLVWGCFSSRCWFPCLGCGACPPSGVHWLLVSLARARTAFREGGRWGSSAPSRRACAAAPAVAPRPPSGGAWKRPSRTARCPPPAARPCHPCMRCPDAPAVDGSAASAAAALVEGTGGGGRRAVRAATAPAAPTIGASGAAGASAARRCQQTGWGGARAQGGRPARAPPRG